MATLTTWRERLYAVLGGISQTTLPPGDAESALRAAVRLHSRSVPRITYADFAGNGSAFDLAITSMTGWVAEFSFVPAVEYPQGEREPVYLDDQEVTLYPSDSAPTAVRLLLTTPATGKTARVYYTVPWPIPDNTAATDKIPDTDFEAVSNLAGHVAANQLASRAAGHQRPAIPAASLAGSESEEGRWARRAKELLELYQRHFGLDEDAVMPADAIIDWDAVSFLDPTHRFLTHGGRR